MIAPVVGDRQFLLKQSIWKPIELLGVVPLWGEPLSVENLWRTLFPGEAMALERPATSAWAPRLYEAPVDDLVDQYCLLAERLACTAFAGEPPGSRPTGSVLVFPQEGVWKVMLKDKAVGKCLWAASPSFLTVFQVLEATLADPHCVWRDDRREGHETARRNKPAK